MCYSYGVYKVRSTSGSSNRSDRGGSSSVGDQMRMPAFVFFGFAILSLRRTPFLPL
jgi:hypothetical protein